MTRPRFHRLAIAQQERILDAALREFAAHGFGDASLNRIIAAAGISKGSMYYYFDDKEDLYAHLIRDRLERVIERAGPFSIPSVRDPDDYWSTIAGHYLRLMETLTASPLVAALLRGWLAGAGVPRLQAAQQDAEQAILPWLSRVLAAGQEIGAVRTDLPTELLISVVTAMGQAIDVWLISQPSAHDDLDHTVHTLIDMIRRSLAP